MLRQVALNDTHEIQESRQRSRYGDCLRTGRLRSRSSSTGWVKNIVSSTSSRPVLGPSQLSRQWASGSLSPGIKLPGREADHSPPTSAEVKETWIYTSTPLQGQFTFTGCIWRNSLVSKLNTLSCVDSQKRQGILCSSPWPEGFGGLSSGYQD
jgi:hypothetical protein